MNTDTAVSIAFEDRFRDVLGNYPTGVVVVTALDDNGEPLGMVVGSFTSVSITPPLVAFMGDMNSATYRQIRGQQRFAVNVLGEGHEEVCQQFASKKGAEKWRGIEQEKSPQGLPVLADAVAWIECAVDSQVAIGDHELFVGRVLDLASGVPQRPLLFFQRGYGRFTPSSFMAPTQADLVAPISAAYSGRDVLERLSREFDATCMLQALVKDSLVFIASSDTGNGNYQKSRVGSAIPYVAPLGAEFAAAESNEGVDNWLSHGSAPFSDEVRAKLAQKLDLVRGRGYSLVLQTPRFAALEDAVSPYSDGRWTPRQLGQIMDLLPHVVDKYQPDLTDQPVDVRTIGVPVPSVDGIKLCLQLWNPRHKLTCHEVAQLAHALSDAGVEISTGIKASRSGK